MDRTRLAQAIESLVGTKLAQELAADFLKLRQDVATGTLERAAAWIMAELIRCASGIQMEEAGALIRLVNPPVGTLVEEIDGVRLVHAKVPLRKEILVLLHSRHPDSVTSTQLCDWTGKTRATVSARLSDLRSRRLIVGGGSRGFKLTSPGHAAATAEIQGLQA